MISRRFRDYLPAAVIIGLAFLTVGAGLAFATVINSPTAKNSAGQLIDALPVYQVDSLGNASIGGVAVTGSSGNVANASAVATLAADAAKTTYISGFQCNPGGATAALPVSVTVVGVIGGTMTYTAGAPAGVLLVGTPLVVAFNPPIPATAINTAIVVTMPALGAGNTKASCDAQGFQL